MKRVDSSDSGSLEMFGNDEEFHMVPSENYSFDFTKKLSFNNLLVSSKCKLMGSLYNIVHPSKIIVYIR